LLKAGEYPKVISERLGHSQIGITMDIYSHIMPGMQKQAADKIEMILAGKI
jgi:integrase